MKQDILNLILQAENEYHAKVKSYVAEAEKYVDLCKQKQSAYMENLKYEWYVFEKGEKEKFERDLADTEKRIDAETAVKKERLKTRQEENIEALSERLKEEVLSFVWR